MTKVLDSWAVIAFLNDEPAAKQVEQLIIAAREGKMRLLLCVINWGEIYYIVLRKSGVALAERAVAAVATLGIELVGIEDDLHLVREAAKLKASKMMSYADCFTAALAKINKGEIVTGDPEFKEVEGEVKIAWLPGK